MLNLIMYDIYYEYQMMYGISAELQLKVQGPPCHKIQGNQSLDRNGKYATNIKSAGGWSTKMKIGQKNGGKRGRRKVIIPSVPCNRRRWRKNPKLVINRPSSIHSVDRVT